jgi:hypothetical protein
MDEMDFAVKCTGRFGRLCTKVSFGKRDREITYRDRDTIHGICVIIHMIDFLLVIEMDPKLICKPTRFQMTLYRMCVCLSLKNDGDGESTYGRNR